VNLNKFLNKNNFFFSKRNHNLYPIYKIICKKIPGSIFSKLGYMFFKNLIKKKIIKCYYLCKQNQCVSIITIVEHKNFNNISKEILFFLLFNPKILILNIFHFINNFKKRIKSNFNHNNLHLLHLIIFKKYFSKTKLIFKDNFFNLIFIKILKENNANSFFLCFEKNNLAAQRFYLRNKFRIYDENKNIVYAKKKFYEK
jgi:hypothetical protein